MRTDTQTIVAAMRNLAATIQSDDGVANAAIAEAADRLGELHDACESKISMNAIMVRQASDDFEAMLTADAMQSVMGAEVVSIAFERPGLWHVFAKYDSAVVTPDQVDTAIYAGLLSRFALTPRGAAGTMGGAD